MTDPNSDALLPLPELAKVTGAALRLPEGLSLRAAGRKPAGRVNDSPGTTRTSKR